MYSSETRSMGREIMWILRERKEKSPILLSTQKEWQTQTIQLAKAQSFGVRLRTVRGGECISIWILSAFLSSMQHVSSNKFPQKPGHLISEIELFCFIAMVFGNLREIQDSFWLWPEMNHCSGTERTPSGLLGWPENRKEQNLWSYHYLQEQNVDLM